MCNCGSQLPALRLHCAPQLHSRPQTHRRLELVADKYWPEANVHFETGTVCGELLQRKVDIAIRAADGSPQPFSRHDARQVLLGSTVLKTAMEHSRLRSLNQMQDPDSKHCGKLVWRSERVGNFLNQKHYGKPFAARIGWRQR